MQILYNTSAPCTAAINLPHLYCGPLSNHIQTFIALSIVFTIAALVCALDCFCRAHPDRIVAELQRLNDSEQARLQQEVQDRAEDLEDAAQIAEDNRVRAQLRQEGGGGQFPARAAPIRIDENGVVHPQDNRLAHHPMLADFQQGLGRGGSFAAGLAPDQEGLNLQGIDGFEMDDLGEQRPR